MNRTGTHPAHRRRANIMLFVIFILGSLFAASMGFLATMRVDRDALAGEAQERDVSAVVDSVIDEVLVGRRSTLLGPDGIPYNQDWPVSPSPAHLLEREGDSALAPNYPPRTPANPDMMDRWAEAPGAHPWLSSIEPYNARGNRVSDLEYFARTDFAGATDGKPDVSIADPDTSAFQRTQSLRPARPTTRPLRLRAYDSSGQPLAYLFDQTDDAELHAGSISDADGDGFVDSRAVRLSRLGGGEVDWVPAIATALDGPGEYDDPLCNLFADPSGLGGDETTWTGPPSYTTDRDDRFTPLPCDHGGNLQFDEGTRYPSLIRRDVASQIGPDANDLPDQLRDEVYASISLVCNGGMVNVNDSYFSLVDNLLGVDGQGVPVAAAMTNLPYGPATEAWLRRRFVLPPRDVSDSVSLGVDLLRDTDSARALSTMLLGPVQFSSTGGAQWYPVFQQPGSTYGNGNVFEDVFATKLMNPYAWQQPGGVGFQPEYDVRHLLTTSSSDDLMRRKLPEEGLEDAAVLDPREIRRRTVLGDPGRAALALYPGYSSAFLQAVRSQSGLPTSDPPGDQSFFDIIRNQNGIIVDAVPKVPIGLPLDPLTGELVPGDDIRMGGMQLWLHSLREEHTPLGRVILPTLREIETVRAYFVSMLSMVEREMPDTPTPAGLAEQAAQLTANFFDFADYDSTPTIIEWAPDRFVAGFEKEPFITEVVLSDGSSAQDPNQGIELFYPHPRDWAAGDVDLSQYAFRRVSGGTPGGLIEIDASGLGAFNSQPQNRYMAITDQEVLDATELNLLSGGDALQLVRKLTLPDGRPAIAVVDEFELTGPDGNPPGDQYFSLKRDTDSWYGWRAPVPAVADPVLGTGTGSLGSSNGVTVDVPPMFATVSDDGYEAAYPTTGSMLLLLRYASTVVPDNDNSTVAALTEKLDRNRGQLDNGHMPVFNQAELAQSPIGPHTEHTGALYGVDRLAIPWGQLIFDFFTVVPYANRFDPTDAAFVLSATRPVSPDDRPDLPAGNQVDDDGDGLVDEPGFRGFLRANQPTVEAGGLVVRGRININSAPWKVLEGLPVLSPWALPVYRDFKWMFQPSYTGFPPPSRLQPGTATWGQMTTPDSYGNDPMTIDDSMYAPTAVAWTPMSPNTQLWGEFQTLEQLGREKAQGIVAYREQRSEFDESLNGFVGGNFNILDQPPGNVFDASLPWRARIIAQDRTTPTLNWENWNQRPVSGFLGVGELANVRHNLRFPGLRIERFYYMDNGMHRIQEFAGVPNYLFAIAPLVSLNDAWVTVKGHAYTLYGTVRSAGRVDGLYQPANPTATGDANKNAIRFEVGIDRSNLLLDPQNPNLRPTVTYSVREPYLPTSPN